MTTAQPSADLVPAVLDLVSDIRAERDRLLDNLRDQSARLAAKDALCATLEAALAAANRELGNYIPPAGDSSAPAGEQTRKDLAAIKKRNKDLQTELAAATKRATKLEVDLANARHDYQQTRQHAASLEDKLARKSKELNSVTETLHDRTDERDALTDELQQVRKELAGQHEVVREYHSQAERAHADKEQSAKKLSAVEQALANERDAHARDLNKQGSTIRKLEEDAATAEKNLAAARKNHQAAIKKWTDDYAKLQEKLTKTEAELEELKSKPRVATDAAQAHDAPGVDAAALRRHLATALNQFDVDEEKSLRALKRALSLLDEAEGRGQ